MYKHITSPAEEEDSSSDLVEVKFGSKYFKTDSKFVIYAVLTLLTIYVLAHTYAMIFKE